jgi:hypothetical protein
MSNLKMKDFDGSADYLKMRGTGTDLDPHVPVQDVFIQDQSTRALDLKFLHVANPPTTLTVATAVNDFDIQVTSAVGFSVGRIVGVFDGAGNYYFGEVLAVNALVITLDTPIDRVFGIGASVISGDSHLNVLGSKASPVKYQITSGGTLTIDITRIMGNITSGDPMDDGKFGGITALTNGVVLRHTNGEIINYWNVKSNGDIALICFDASYSTKAPGGENGFRFRNTYGGPAKHGVVLRLAPSDKLEVIVQDDLTGLTDFQMMAQGHVVE